MTFPLGRVDPNGVKAGKYELLDNFWDRPTSKPGDPGHPTYERIYQGEVVHLEQAEAQRLSRAGSVVPEGQREERAAALAEQRFLSELNALSPETRQRVLDGLKKSAVPEGVIDPEAGGAVVQDQPGFVAPDNPVVAVRANAQGDGGPDPQGDAKQPEVVQEQATSVADAVPEEQATREHREGSARSRRGNQ